MGGGGGGEGETSDNTIRFPEYLETLHHDFLNDQGSDWPNISLVDALNAAWGNSPYGGAVFVNPAPGMFGTGYNLTSFPSLFDMFGKFVAGLDLHTLWEKTYNGVIASSPVGLVIDAQAEKLSDDIEERVLPRFEAGMRDIGAIHSSAFAAGRALIEDTRVRALNEFSTKLQLGLLETTTALWQVHTQWNQAVVATYAELQRIQQQLQIEANTHNTTLQAKHVTFDLDLFEYARALLGALNGAPAATGPGDKAAGPSPLAKGLSGAVAGAAAGSYFSWVGAVVGGVIGFAAGYFS